MQYIGISSVRLVLLFTILDCSETRRKLQSIAPLFGMPKSDFATKNFQDAFLMEILSLSLAPIL